MLLKLPKIELGYTPVTDMNDIAADMLMDIGVQKIAKGSEVEFLDMKKETAFLLLSGNAIFNWEQETIAAERISLFDEAPTALHVPKGIKVVITGGTDVEILIQKTDNDNYFEPKFYAPSDCTNDIFGEDVWNNTARRVVRTVFDLTNAPYSNMVLGEVINYSGSWSSYIPHGHDQPEVYYYRFQKEEGFGAAFIGDDTFKISDNSALCIPGGPTHPQVAAPGYPMWYCWMIRHLDGNPWDKRVNDERYEWLLDENVKIWPEK